MKTGILPLGSSLHDANKLTRIRNEFLPEVRRYQDCEYVDEASFASVDFLIVMVMTGGSEGQFIKIWPALKAKGLPLVIVATRNDNSLPAAIEILSWLRQQEKSCDIRIIHGTYASIAVELDRFIKREKILADLRQQIAGIIGPPSDWLIASMPELEKVEKRLGFRFVNISMTEFKAFCDKADASALSDFARVFYGFGQKEKTAELARAAKIYGGLMRCIKQYGLTALTLRCFDILADDKTTGCLGIAKLNDDGIPASCEGDVPALATMILARLATGKASFMANPSRIEGDEVTFAHCTCPVSMLEQVSIKTHFESGIGMALAGTLKEQTYTLLKLDLSENQYAVQVGEVATRPYSQNLCRTQLCLQLPGAADYFLKRPSGNHHILIAGNHLELLSDLCDALKFKPVW